MTGVAMLNLAPGRKELGWEVGFSAVAGTTSPNPVASIIVDNDADFVATRLWVFQFGSPAGNTPLPNTIKLNVRDGATGNVMCRIPVVPDGFCAVPYPGQYTTSAKPQTGRWAGNFRGLPAPYLIRRGGTVFFEFSNPTGFTFLGDLYCVLEGFRLYTGEKDPVPAQVKGYVIPYSWGGTLTVPGALANGFQSLGSITMPGPGPGAFLLKYASLNTTNPADAQNGILPPSERVLALQIRDTLAQGKFWARMTQPPSNIGQYVPASAFVGGGTGAPWPQPRYIDGQSTINVDVFGDPACFSANNNTPGVVEVQLNGMLALG